MVTFTTPIRKFGEQGEKTGWSYLEIPSDIAELLKPGNKRSFRVKGKLDRFSIQQVSLLPMGGGIFILPLNADIRKGIHKKVGAMIKLQLTEDQKPLEVCQELLDCLNDEPKAWDYFNKLPPSHQRYFSKWILSAKTEATKTKRIAKTVNALARNLDYGAMMREK